MRFLLLTVTILSIIGAVWYNNKLETSQQRESESLVAEYEKAEETTQQKIDKLDKEMNEASTAIDLEEDIYQKKIWLCKIKENWKRKQVSKMLKELCEEKKQL